MSLARDEKKEEENPGSDDHDLHSPEGYVARYVLRHPQFPDREDAPAGLLTEPRPLAGDAQLLMEKHPVRRLPYVMPGGTGNRQRYRYLEPG